jgi:stage II sporulation protein D
LVTQGDDSQPIRVLLTTGKVQSFPMKTYLASVVASEMPSNWPVAALEAQAIASRTYARWESDPTKPYDVTSTVSTQVFGQPAVPSTIAAVQATAGQVLTDGTWVIPAYYHSCSPYRTDSNAAVWPNQQPNPYLSGIDDRDAAGVPYADACPSMSWQAGPFSVTDFSAILNADPRTTVGQVQTLLFGTLSPGGRWETITIQGDKGSKTVDLSVFREVMNKSAKPGHVISSANFQIVTVAPAVPGTPPPAISFIQ